MAAPPPRTVVEWVGVPGQAAPSEPKAAGIARDPEQDPHPGGPEKEKDSPTPT